MISHRVRWLIRPEGFTIPADSVYHSLHTYAWTFHTAYHVSATIQSVLIIHNRYHIESDRMSRCIRWLIKPEGFTIPAEATAVHKITTKHALENGMDFDTDLMDTLG